MAGIDLHSNNIMVGLVDREGKRVARHKSHRAGSPAIVKFLAV